MILYVDAVTKFEKKPVPKLLRSSTQTNLIGKNDFTKNVLYNVINCIINFVVQYSMKQMNPSGEMVGYFNESWSEAEICKSGLDPKEIFKKYLKWFLKKQ